MSAASPALPLPSPPRALGPRRETPLRLVAFAALGTFAAAHYARLVAAAPTGRLIATVAIATAAAAGLALLEAARLHPLARAAAAAAIVAAATWGALVAAGVPGRLLLPAHWSALVADVGDGLGGLSGFDWPYSGADEWARLAALLPVPIAAVGAAALAFWPARRWRSARRGASLTLLVAVYGIGVTEYPAGGWAWRGAALLVLIAAWTWLPRLRLADVPRATVPLLAAAALALGLTAAVHADHPLVDYHSWNWFSGVGGGTQFAWDQTYGPISWPRTQMPLLSVRARSPHYWKAETLDRFDGLRFMHSTATPAPGPSASLPLTLDPRWVERVAFTVTGLRTNLVVSPGTILSIETSKITSSDPDGATRVVDAPLARGDSYSVTAYVPDPTPAALRRAPATFPRAFLPYTSFDLPSPHQSGLAGSDLGATARDTFATSRTIEAPAPGVAPSANPALVRRILASPYARVYRLARRLAVGRRSVYDVASAIDAYLGRGYSYSETPPRRRYPLAAFLFDDRSGYCQQFSGAMALLLRMDGIPARVAVGFAPGGYDAATGRYVVRALDAHAWVEVLFSGIGWVPFDPTPTAAPEVLHSPPDPATAAPHAPAASGGGGAPATAGGQRAIDVGRSARHRGGFPFALAAGTALALAAVALLVLSVWSARAARRRARDPDAALAELRRALQTLGYDCPPRTTLLALERRLAVTAGPAAARYVRLLRERRFAPAARTGPGPGPADRTLARRELAAGAGPIARLRSLTALPPEPPRLLALLNLLAVGMGRR